MNSPLLPPLPQEKLPSREDKSLPTLHEQIETQRAIVQRLQDKLLSDPRLLESSERLREVRELVTSSTALLSIIEV